ncbi:MAG: signal peptidase I [Candidatus Izemoplasmatales bacterium]|nr:signal peptidase I [Candidatus Izemoplasmatales bacterium]
MENTINPKKKTLKIVGNVVFWVVLVVVLVYSALALFSEKDDNMTSLFGISSLTVQSGSMSPTFDEGDLIFVRTNFDVAKLKADFEAGKTVVITFKAIEAGETYYNTHTVIDIEVIGSLTWFETRGDAAPLDETEKILSTSIVGVWNGTSWSGWGTFLDSFIGFLKSSIGFLLFIVLPCLIFLVYEIIRFTKIYSQYQVQKSIGDRVKFQEEALAIARAQLEAEKKQAEEEQK